MQIMHSSTYAGGLLPRFLDILSRLFVNILQSTLANLHILLQSTFVAPPLSLPQQTMASFPGAACLPKWEQKKSVTHFTSTLCPHLISSLAP